jgi:hypothetical protein
MQKLVMAGEAMSVSEEKNTYRRVGLTVVTEERGET